MTNNTQAAKITALRLQAGRELAAAVAASGLEVISKFDRRAHALVVAQTAFELINQLGETPAAEVKAQALVIAGTSPIAARREGAVIASLEIDAL